MSHPRHAVLAIALTTVAIGSWAQTDAEHAQHQANALGAEQSFAQKSDSATPPGGAEKMAALNSKIKTMQEMHEKMMNAKTPEERKALMAEHMKIMQDGMKTMSMMGGAGMAGMQGQKQMPGNMNEHHQMMEKRMEMMETMMQMMIDRMAPPAAK
jgi:hypothetical protein